MKLLTPLPKPALVSLFAGTLLLAACGDDASKGGGDGVGVGSEKSEGKSAGGIEFAAPSIAGHWILAIDTSDAARESIGAGGTGGITVSIMPSAPVGDFGAESPADSAVMRYALDIDTDENAITRCVARDLSEAEPTYVTTACKLEKDRLIVTIGSEANGGVMRSELARAAEGGPLEGRTLMVAKALPMDVVMGKASLTAQASDSAGDR